MPYPDRTIPQRELRNDIGKVLREVERGRTIRVTVDGRPVADLVPVPQRRAAVPWGELMRLLHETPVDGAAWARDIVEMDEPIPADDPWQSQS